MALRENERLATEAADRLAVDVYDNRLFDRQPDMSTTPQERRSSRVALWVGTALGLYALGQMFRPDDPNLQWRVGPTEHCGDCLRLDGQIHTASEWRASGWQPQGRNLECHGYRCQCGLYETNESPQGNF